MVLQSATLSLALSKIEAPFYVIGFYSSRKPQSGASVRTEAYVGKCYARLAAFQADQSVRLSDALMSAASPILIHTHVDV
jgi:hypothetical protein